MIIVVLLIFINESRKKLKSQKINSTPSPNKTTLIPAHVGTLNNMSKCTTHTNFYFQLYYYLLITIILVQYNGRKHKRIACSYYCLIFLFIYFFCSVAFTIITPTAAVTPASNWLNLSEGLVHKDSNGRYFQSGNDMQ